MRKLQVIVQIVDGVEAGTENLVDALQVVQIGPREVAAGVAATFRIERAGVLAVARVATNRSPTSIAASAYCASKYGSSIASLFVAR